MELNRTITKYWKAFVSSLNEEKLKRDRAKLDQEVRRRQEEAAKSGITSMLLDVYKEGYGYQPWITNYQSNSPKSTVNFSIKEKSYILKWDKYTHAYDGSSTVTVSLSDSERELFRDNFKEDCDEFGLTYQIDKYGFGVKAYVPGQWVTDLKSALGGVAKQKQEDEFKARHAKSAMDDMKNKFGL